MDVVMCELCGEPMPEGEEAFRYHGSSGPCPKPPLGTRQAGGSPSAEQTASAEMPRYRCHKIVHALKIAAIEFERDRTVATIAPADPGYAPFKAADGWGSRFHGGYDDPGYYVVYEDGYASWSPTKAFEEGYTRI